MQKIEALACHSLLYNPAESVCHPSRAHRHTLEYVLQGEYSRPEIEPESTHLLLGTGNRQRNGPA